MPLVRAHERDGILRECAASGWTAHPPGWVSV